MNAGHNALNLGIRGCRPKELPAIVRRLDQEFIYSKQRRLSLGKRFSNTLSVENIEQIRVAVSEGEVRGALAIRMFDWIVEESVWHGAMIGMVWVDSQHRGRGFGSSLLSSTTQFLRDKGVDFGVLWTGNPAFYERAGWRLNDRSLFGEAVSRHASAFIDTVSCQPLVSVDATRLERLRSTSLSMRVVRSALDYCTVPIPAAQVLCFFAEGNEGREGFALVGEQDGVGYFYEMIAGPSLWNAIWAAVTERFTRTLANGYSGDPFADWIAENRLVAWRPQHKTMWLRISGRIKDHSIDAWNIPYYDWI